MLSQEHQDARTLCDGCGLPIDGEPMTHFSALNFVFVVHDFKCCLTAHEKEMWYISKRNVPTSLNEGYGCYPQHDDLFRGMK